MNLFSRYKAHEYFILTQNDHGMFYYDVENTVGKIWEMFGNVQFFQCEHGEVFEARGEKEGSFSRLLI